MLVDVLIENRKSDPTRCVLCSSKC